jgi:hypothetical protein
MDASSETPETLSTTISGKECEIHGRMRGTVENEDGGEAPTLTSN